MKSRTIIQQKQRLDALFKRIEELPPDDFELRSHWARYLCILVSGFLETSIREIYAEYAKNKAHPYIANYLVTQLSSFQNPRMEKILQLVGCFNLEWKESLKIATQGKLKDSVDSIVNNRNQIAHGRQTPITYHNISNYYKNAVKVIELIEEQCSQ